MKLYTLSISGLIGLQLHSLNNEGGEGNVTQTRIVEIVDDNGELQAVNAISGDMFKHIQAKHLHNIALKENLPLCSACKHFNANRINASDELENLKKQKDEKEKFDSIIKACTIDDIEGILVTEGGMALGVKSKVEFGWVIGLPEKTKTNSYFHVKFDIERGKGSGSETGRNIGQNIFHRPASSGLYATVMNAELYRVGKNDYTLQYSIPPTLRIERIKALLNSIIYTYVHPDGAMTSFQLPHITGFSGIISTSTSYIPAPIFSPLNPNYRDEIQKIAQTLGESIRLYPFNSLGEFTEIMTELTNSVEPVEA
ncbi:MAG: DevR family CRISPR-associated autoregulator [bacterium]